MAGPSWLVDSKRIATKIKSASAKYDSKRVIWKSNPSRACPNCDHIIDNSDVTQEWPGLPCGVKFDPSDQEIIWHLIAKVGNGNVKLHPFLEEFIPTVNEEDGICYTHPQNLPGVKQDGSVSHFFHRAIKAYNTGTRKRRKIHGDELGEVRWHKTGRTKPVIVDGIQMGCKKIMVLYMNTAKSGKPEKTNWVMHQYHLGTGEDENDGEFVLSKVFYQQQTKLADKVEQDLPGDITEPPVTKVDPVTPKSIIPEPPRVERWLSDVDPGREQEHCAIETSVQDPLKSNFTDMPIEGVLGDHNIDTTEDQENITVGDHDDTMVDSKLWPGASQFPLDSQQLDSQYNSQELLALCNDLLRSQPSSQLLDGVEDGEAKRDGPDYSRSEAADVLEVLGCENSSHQNQTSTERRIVKACLNHHVQGLDDAKEDLEEVENTNKVDLSDIALDTPPDFRLSQIVLGTPPDFRLSQIEFESDDSFFNWAGSKLCD